MIDRKLLMIPGPIEFSTPVLSAFGQPSLSHTDPALIEAFGQCLSMMREAWLSPSGQPFIVAGSGTLAMEMAAANLIERGHRALVVSTGYFGERYAQILKRYGAEVTVLAAEPGATVPLEAIEQALARGDFRLVTFTHVDTSTGVLNDPRPIAELARKHGALSILDGVCSIGGEEMRQDGWGVDVAVTASQKAVGAPPGLALMVASPRAMEAWRSRQSPVASYFCDWGLWLPVMEAYEQRRPSYFATPPVNHIMALRTALGEMLTEGMEPRWERHRRLSGLYRDSLRQLGLAMLPQSEAVMAHTLTAAYYPKGVDAAAFLSAAAGAGVVLAGGLLPALRTAYFRTGHMGMVTEHHIHRALCAAEAGLSAKATTVA